MNDRDPAGIHQTVIALCLVIIALFVLAVTLSYTHAIMIPFVVALFISYFLAPAVEFLKDKYRVPHSIAVLSSLIVFGALIFGFGVVIHDSIGTLLNSFYFYESKLGLAVERLVAIANDLQIPLDRKSILNHLQSLPVVGVLHGAASIAGSLLMNILLVIIFLGFIVSGHSLKQKKSGIRLEIDQKIRTYIVTKIATSLIIGVFVGVLLAVLGLDMALMFGLLAFLLGFIPTLGSIIATLLPLPVALLEFDEPWRIWLVVLLPGALQLLVGNVLEPKILGKGLDLHPITVILSLMFWGLIWGFVGMFLAVPITAAMKIVFEKIEITRGFSELMAGRIPN